MSGTSKVTQTITQPWYMSEAKQDCHTFQDLRKFYGEWAQITHINGTCWDIKKATYDPVLNKPILDSHTMRYDFYFIIRVPLNNRILAIYESDSNGFVGKLVYDIAE